MMNTNKQNNLPQSNLDAGAPNATFQQKVFVETYGCQMNEYDTELVRSILTKAGYGFTSIEDDADIIMLNTCAIRENAHRKVYGRIHEILHRRTLVANGRFSPAGENLPLIGILGCMATNLRTELFENRGLKIDFICGPDSYKRLPELIRQTSGELGKKAFDVTLSEFETYSDIYPQRTKGVNPSTRPAGSLRAGAWIAVMRGCNNFCTFCVVPYTRGRERSRSPENIVEEVKRLADDGFKQVTLLGQNVNSYRHEDTDFAELLEEVSQVEGIGRIRFTSPHPKDFPDRLLNVIAENPKVCKHIHLPLQAGNNRILELMNRTYTQEEFLALVDKIRKWIPGVTLTTDVIVGFCSETDEEFEDTVKALQRIEFDSAFIFKYSERKNTIAARKYKNDVSAEKKTERIVRLNEIQNKISLKKNQAQVGETLEVLLESLQATKTKDAFQGRTDGNTIVTFPQGPYQLADTLKVRILSASPHSLKGEVVGHAV